MQNYDYIVVGSGSSGSVITNRLSEISNISVCVIEAGAVSYTHLTLPTKA